MDMMPDAERFLNRPIASQIASRMLDLAAHGDAKRMLEQAVSAVRQVCGADVVSLAYPDRGRWIAAASAGAETAPPAGLFADVLDGGGPLCREGWIVAPLDSKSDSGELLAVHGAELVIDVDRVDALAAVLGCSLAIVRRQGEHTHRIRRLEAILEIAGQWNRTLEMEPLLVRMAETSTRLLDAQRASIFLWDRPNKTLVGRPALGVASGELRVADDSGIVGQVVQTGKPRRVDVDQQDQIDRQVDRQLEFRTETLLCVPLIGAKGKCLGAFELINKVGGNFTAQDEAALVELAGHASIALENSQQYQQLLDSRKQMAEQAADRVRLIGESPAIEALRSTVRRVADTELAILVLGENGTGKEVVSQMVHYLSRRRDEPFIAVNCAALTETLLESELFGHEKGAFTDAHEARAGRFELASGGTLFLDEIGDLSPGGQAKLLRVLEEKVVVRVGGSRPIHTDARVIAATNQNLAQMVRERRFREDLYFRLNVVTLELPPLRDRGDDVLLLAGHFLETFSAAARRRPPELTVAARKRLRQHPWPGNIRELRNLMERLAYLTAGQRIDTDDLAFILAPGGPTPGLVPLDLPLSEATRQFQRDYVNKHVEACGGNMTDAASRLGLHRSNLYRKLRQLGIDADEAP